MSKTEHALALLDLVDSDYSETVADGMRVREYRLPNGGRCVVVMDKKWADTRKGKGVE